MFNRSRLAWLLAVVGPIFVTAQVVSKEALHYYELTTTEITKRSVAGEIEQRAPIAGGRVEGVGNDAQRLAHLSALERARRDDAPREQALAPE